MACAASGPVISEDILLTGADTMGLLLQLLNQAGARSVSMVDRKAARLQAAKALGAASVAEDVAALDRRAFGVAGDATGAPAAIEAGFNALDRGRRLLVFGVASGDADVSFSPFRTYNDEITVLGSMAVLNSFGAATDLMAADAIDTAPLLGPRHRLAEFPGALAHVPHSLRVPRSAGQDVPQRARGTTSARRSWGGGRGSGPQNLTHPHYPTSGPI
jgi:threonine dehydrogenase-like Zn-dependent dehydrogenase